jgi:transcriptional regulator with XRE-family HTH domain
MRKGDGHRLERIAFGEAIVAVRKQADLSQEELANASQIDRSYVGRIERGEQSVSFDKILDLCGALGIEPVALFERMVKNLSGS